MLIQLKITLICTFVVYLYSIWILCKYEIPTKLLNCEYCLSFWTTFITLTILYNVTIDTIICSIIAFWLQVLLQKNNPFF
jgi:hypothetical protein